jgi:hypothetical protein
MGDSNTIGSYQRQIISTLLEIEVSVIIAERVKIRIIIRVFFKRLPRGKDNQELTEPRESRYG